MNSNLKQNSLLVDLKHFTKDVFLFHPVKASFTLLLMLTVGLTNGASIAIIIPLIQVAGLGEVSTTKNIASKVIINGFHYFGLSPTLGGVLLFFLLINLIMVFFQYLHVKFASTISNNYSAHIRQRLYRQIFNAQWLFFIKEKMASVANILTADAHRVRIASESLIRLISESLVSVFYLALAFVISWQVTALIVLVGTTISWFMRSNIHRGRHIGKKITDENSNLQSTVWEHLGSAKIIKGHAAETQSFNLFRDIVYKIADLYNHLMVGQAGIRAVFESITICLLCVVLYIGITFLKMDMAHIIVLLFIFFRLFPKIISIQQSYHQLLTSLPAYSALLALENEARTMPEYTDKGKALASLKTSIRLHNVSFAYQGDGREILNAENLIIPAGKTVAVVGESGAGKSTIADLILGLLRPTSGDIYIDDINIQTLDLRSWRSLIGYVTQDIVLFHDSVRANLLWANPDADEKEIADALKTAAADIFVNNLPAGINTVVGDRGIRLSGGQRQRLALARALLRKPKLLILDEATSSLDAESEFRIQEAIESLHGSMTMLVIAHRLATVRHADLIYIIEKGRFIESGSWEDLVKNKSEYFMKICALQGITS